MLKFTYENERIYAVDNAGLLLAEVTFPIRNGVAHINHTFVSNKLRGQGVAGKLVELLAEHLKERGLKAKAICPYVVDWAAKNPGKFELV